MLTPSLALYLYLIPIVVMLLGAWVYVFFWGEDSWIYPLIAVAVLIVYPLWVWWWGVFPAQLDTEAFILLVMCLGLAVIGTATAALTDGTW